MQDLSFFDVFTFETRSQLYEAPIRFVQSFRPPVRLKQLEKHWTDFNEI
jgi:hypothetical protein